MGLVRGIGLRIVPLVVPANFAACANATVENLSRALDKSKVDPKDKSELLGMLVPMKADIVGQ